LSVSAYRLVKRKWAATVFDGEGARLFGGRWNSQGVSCVYSAGSEALAILEVLVHVDNHALLRNYQLFRIEIPRQSIRFLEEKKWPAGWRKDPAPQATADLGDAWLANDPPQLALAVPSVVVPREWNYLLNPQHPAFESIVAQAQTLDFDPDPRLFGNGD
jgi:RES domain-containing protein